MTDRLDELEAKLGELAQAIERVQARLDALEMRALETDRPEPSFADDLPAIPEPEPERKTPADGHAPTETLMGIAAISGRSFLILGGAYLLRAVTDSKVLPEALGAPLALVYAAIWLFLARRQSQKHPELDPFAYGLTFALIAYPLLVEISTRFSLLSPRAGSVALGLVTALGLAVAWETRRSSLAWVLLLGAVGAGAALGVKTHAVVPVMLLLVVVPVAIDWVANHRGWLYVRIAAAFVANISMIVLSAIALLEENLRPAALLIALTLFGLYVGSFVLHALFDRRAFSTFERFQAGAVLLVGYLGSMILAEVSAPIVGLWLGAASVGLGIASYAVVYFSFARRSTRRIDVWYFTSYALVGVLAGSWALMHDPAYAWAATALLLAVLGTRDEHAALSLHAAIAALLAAVASGLVLAVGYAFAGSASASWPSLAVPALVTMLVAAVVYLAPLRSDNVLRRTPARVAKTLALSVVVLGIGALFLGVFGAAVADVAGSSPDAGRLAALRSGVLALAALALALVSRVGRFHDAGLLVYPILAAGGVKLVLEDFPNGRPLTLFAAFLCYGAALIVAPRVRRRALQRVT